MPDKQTSRAVTALVASAGVLMVAAVLFTASRTGETQIASAAAERPNSIGSGADNPLETESSAEQPRSEATGNLPLVSASSEVGSGTSGPASSNQVANQTFSSNEESASSVTSESVASPASAEAPATTLRQTTSGSTTSLGVATSSTAPTTTTGSAAGATTTTVAATSSPTTAGLTTTAPTTTTSATAATTTTEATVTSTTAATTTTEAGLSVVPNPLTTATPGGTLTMAANATTMLILPKGSAAPGVSGPLLAIPIASLVDTGDERWELRATGEGEAVVAARTADESIVWTIKVTSPGS